MTKEQEVIVELFNILDDITERCMRKDLSFARVPRVSGCDMYQGSPPIRRNFDSIYDKYQDIICDALDAYEKKRND